MVNQTHTSRQSNSYRFSSKDLHCHRAAGLRCAPLPVAALVRRSLVFAVENQTQFLGEAF
jgi:hypothetical protein